MVLVGFMVVDHRVRMLLSKRSNDLGSSDRHFVTSNFLCPALQILYDASIHSGVVVGFYKLR